MFNFAFDFFSLFFCQVGSVVPDMPLVTFGALIGNHLICAVPVGVDNACGAERISLTVKRLLGNPYDVLAINVLIPMASSGSPVFHTTYIRQLCNGMEFRRFLRSCAFCDSIASPLRGYRNPCKTARSRTLLIRQGNRR